MFVCTTHKSWTCAQNFFLQTLQAENFQNASQLHGKQLRFWTYKSWNCSQNLFCKPCKRSTSKVRLHFAANSFDLGHVNREIAPKTFSANLGSGELPKCVSTSRQTFIFGRINREIAPRTFYAPRKAKTSKMRLNFMSNSFVIGRINREIAPRTFSTKLAVADRKLPKCVWISRETASFFDA